MGVQAVNKPSWHDSCKRVQLNAPKWLVACLGGQMLRTEGLLSTVGGLRLRIHWDGECYGRTQALHTLGFWGLWEDSHLAYTEI